MGMTFPSAHPSYGILGPSVPSVSAQTSFLLTHASRRCEHQEQMEKTPLLGHSLEGRHFQSYP